MHSLAELYCRVLNGRMSKESFNSKGFVVLVVSGEVSYIRNTNNGSIHRIQFAQDDIIETIFESGCDAFDREQGLVSILMSQRAGKNLVSLLLSLGYDTISKKILTEEYVITDTVTQEARSIKIDEVPGHTTITIKRCK